jgi:hypothetical protein
MSENQSRTWLLTAGQYDGYTVLGVFQGTQAQVLRKANEMTAERTVAGEPSDMIKVSIEKTEVL